jgi:hypothetical protein
MKALKSRSLASLGMTKWLGMTALLGMTAIAACDSTKPRPVVDIVPAGGNGESGIAGVPMGNLQYAKAVDVDGAGIAGVTVNWMVSVGGGSIATSSSVTNDEGKATPGPWTLGQIAGTNSLTASVPGLEKTLLIFATGHPGPPAIVTPQSGNNQVTSAGAPVPVNPSVRVTDQFSNPVSAVAVTFTVSSGGGSVSSTLANTNINGIASSGGWTLGPESGTHTLTATISGASPATFTATATAPPTQLAVATQPDGVITGEVFDVQPAVSVRDASNNLVPTSNALVTASIASGTGTLTGNTSVAAVNGVATFTNLAVTGNSPVTLNFTAAGLTDATSSSFTPGPPPPLNLTIDRIHLNQGTQTYAGGVPIVAGRPAMARVFVKANVTNPSTPSVRLTTYVNGSPFKVYNIAAPGSPTKVIDESVLNNSWNVLIPADEVVMGMTVLAEVDPTNTVEESSEADNAYPATGTPLVLDVRQVNTMKVTFVPVSQPNGVVAGNINEANKNAAVDFARRVFPIDTFDIVVRAPLAYGLTLSGTGYDTTWTKLLNQIEALRVAEAPDRYFYGLAHPAYSSGGTGLGRLGVGAAIGMDFTSPVNPSTDYYRMTIAHEWGHNFNRQHIACGNPAGPDLNYPHDAQTTIGAHGYDLLTGVLRKATDFKEFMSYCQPLWTSDYTYKAVMEWRTTHAGPPVAAKQNVLLVWGQIGPDGVTLEPAYEIEAPIQFPTESGPYTVQALDESGRSMFAISFAGGEIDHAPGVRTFAYAVPLPASGARPATLRLLNGSRELTRRSRPMGSTSGGATMSAVTAPTRLVQVAPRRSRLEWDAKTYPGAMVRDPATGQILAFLTGGSGEINVAGDVDVVFSTGVSSVKERVRIVPR